MFLSIVLSMFCTIVRIHVFFMYFSTNSVFKCFILCVFCVKLVIIGKISIINVYDFFVFITYACIFNFRNVLN